MTSVEDRGLWPVAELGSTPQLAESAVLTLCERTLEDARTYELEAEPKPLCSRCRERLRGL